MASDASQVMIFPGVKDDSLAAMVAKRLGRDLSPIKFVRFAGSVPGGGETKPEVLCNVKGRDCFIIWSVKNTNDEIFQIVQLINALKKVGEAYSVTLMVGCYPYARQDKSHGRREPVSASVLASVLEMNKFLTRIIWIDVHADQIEGFFREVNVRSMWMDNLWVDYLTKRFEILIPHLGIGEDAIKAMPPDEGAVYSNYRIAKVMGNTLAVHLKKRDWSKTATIESLGLAGDVRVKLLYTRDDLVGSGDSLFAAAKEAKANGAKYVIAIVTHAIGYDKDGEKSFIEKLNESDLDELVVTNTLTAFYEQYLADERYREKITIIDIAPYFARIIDRFSLGETIRDMMKQVDASDLYRVLEESDQSVRVSEAKKIE